MSEEVKLLEELRPIGDGYYASNLGRIIGKMGKELRPYITPGGYVQVRFRYGSKLAHRIVAQAFCDNPRPLLYTEVDHINGVKLDNRAANLRWLDRGANLRARHELRERLGLPRQSPAEEERTRKACAAFVAKSSRPIRVRGKVFSSCHEAARQLSIAPSSLRHALKRGQYKGIPVAYV